ncbi:hypothetical protein [Burkholderia sp. TSV86]|uniref:hypothetical protein n=1 Tax=Burkholderia sp. TSV86 TaxID=1385594 RepID=UPI00075DA18C|nr:hypothetical protein [Burkholderia sp. TSV86]KVE38251.1 hypothetical protein WS68_23950 [Burkholderia sp. TSV86]
MQIYRGTSQQSEGKAVDRLDLLFPEKLEPGNQAIAVWYNRSGAGGVKSRSATATIARVDQLASGHHFQAASTDGHRILGALSPDQRTITAEVFDSANVLICGLDTHLMPLELSGVEGAFSTTTTVENDTTHIYYAVLSDAASSAEIKMWTFAAIGAILGVVGVIATLAEGPFAVGLALATAGYFTGAAGLVDAFIKAGPEISGVLLPNRKIQRTSKGQIRPRNDLTLTRFLTSGSTVTVKSCVLPGLGDGTVQLSDQDLDDPKKWNTLFSLVLDEGKNYRVQPRALGVVPGLVISSDDEYDEVPIGVNMKEKPPNSMLSFDLEAGTGQANLYAGVFTSTNRPQFKLNENGVVTFLEAHNADYGKLNRGFIFGEFQDNGLQTQYMCFKNFGATGNGGRVLGHPGGEGDVAGMMDANPDCVACLWQGGGNPLIGYKATESITISYRQSSGSPSNVYLRVKQELPFVKLTSQS